MAVGLAGAAPGETELVWVGPVPMPDNVPAYRPGDRASRNGRAAPGARYGGGR